MYMNRSTFRVLFSFHLQYYASVYFHVSTPFTVQYLILTSRYKYLALELSVKFFSGCGHSLEITRNITATGSDNT